MSNTEPVQPIVPEVTYKFKLNDPNLVPLDGEKLLSQDEAEEIIANLIGMGAKSPDGSLTTIIGLQQQQPGSPLSALVAPAISSVLSSTLSGVALAPAAVTVGAGAGLTGSTEDRTGEAQAQYAAGTKQLLDAIYSTLPKQARNYGSVLGQLDGAHLLRPIYSAFKNVATPGNEQSAVTINGVTVPTGFGGWDVVNYYYPNAIQTTASVVNGLVSAPTDSTPGTGPLHSSDAANNMRSMWFEHLTGDELVQSPVSLRAGLDAKAAGDGGASGTTGIEPTSWQATLDGQGGAGGKPLVPLLTSSDIQQLFRVEDPLSALRDTAGYEDAYTQNSNNPNFTGNMIAPGSFRIDYTQGSMGPRGAQPGNKSYSVTEATNLLYTLPHDQLIALETNLKRAGYFQAGSTGTSASDSTTDISPYISGDPGDPKLQDAWRRAIADGIKTNTPIVQVLNAKAAELVKQGKLDAQGNPIAPIAPRGPMDPIVLEDTDKIRLDADAMAAKLLGRYLAPGELDQMVKFVHGLETQNQYAAYNASGPRPTGTAAPAVEQLDESSAMESYLRLTMPIDDLDKKTKPHPLTADELQMKMGLSHLGDEGGALLPHPTAPTATPTPNPSVR